MIDNERRKNVEGTIFLVLFCLTIPAANWMIGHVGTVCAPNGPCLVPVASGVMAPSGVLMVGAALVLRDLVQRRLGVEFGVGAIIAGAALSAGLAPRSLVLASAVAFLLSEFADFLVYTPLARRRLVAAVVASSIVGSYRQLDRIFVAGVWIARISVRSGPRQALDGAARDSVCRLDQAARRAAWPEPCVRIVMASALEILRNVTTGTITTMLLKKGIRHSWMAGAMPFGFSGKRVVGPAFTLRFVPVREDLATPESWSKPISTRGAIEAMPENCVVVADAMGVTGAGIFGDILCMRMVKRGVTALITDGVMRDKHGVLATGLPVWCAGVAAPASVNQLTFVGWNEPIGCGGCAIFPGDIIVADDDGAVVIPKDLVDFVANEGAEHELLENWLVQEVEKGAKLPGLYPPNEENKKRYEDWKKKR